jgi:lipopolysaccharide export LptBFGC system permease protein LptF
MKLPNVAFYSLVALSVVLVPAIGYCSVENTLRDIQTKLITEILPLCAVLGLCFAAFSFFTGNPSARSHLWLAIIGMVIGFGAESIMRFVQALVH